MELVSIIVRKWVIPIVVFAVLGAVVIATAVYSALTDKTQRPADTPLAPPVYTDDDLHY